jgi:glycosyltransferase involved in cell wall biosynthesis
MRRVVMVADGAWPTGFERVARAVGTHLQATGQYEVVHRALGYGGPEQELRVPPYPYELKSADQMSYDPLAVTNMPKWIKEDRPDVVLFIQDLWNITNYMGYVPRDLPTVGYYPVDTPNIKWSYAMGAASLTEAVTYTDFGAKETALGMRDLVDVVLNSYSNQGVDMSQKASWMTLPKDKMELHLRVDNMAARQNRNGFSVIPHGIDHEMFYPMDKAECRQMWNFPQDAFIVLNVNTNQFRKRQDITIRAFAEMAAKVPNALLVLHCMGGKDREGWDLAQLARLYGVEDKVICTHWAYPELTDEQLLMLYNSADVQINTGGGEGWGLTAVEAALCGVPQFVPDWSATREIWSGHGVLLPVSDYRFEPRYINTAHAMVDVRGTAALLAQYATDRDLLQATGEACRNRALQMPTWDEVGAQFAKRIARALSSDPAVPMRLNEIRDSRRDVLQSDLLIQR